jgi:AGZA family xanthine/uracil permease-like MFS transporter
MAAATQPPAGGLAGRFRLAERGTSARTEGLGGVATFLTMSYILFVNPAILSAAGVPFEAVAVATALAAAIATAAMGLATNLPFALAPGLGINAVVAFDVILGRGLPWAVGMSVVVVEGLIAVVLVLLGLRGAVMRAVPLSLKLAIGTGIGLFITLIGLREGGIVVNDPATGIGLGDLTSGPALVALGGIAVAAVLLVRGIRGAVVLGVLSATALGLIFGVLSGPQGVIDAPDAGDFATIGDALDPSNLEAALTVALIPVIFALFMTDFFDTIGTAVAEGGRTGLTSLVTAGLFVLAIFLVPLIGLVGQGVQVGEDTVIHPAVAPALVMVGYLMIRMVAEIDWSAPETAVPAFLTIAGIPLTVSIAAGIGLGVLGYVLVMAATARARDVHPLMWAIAALFVLFFAADWLSANVF